MANPQIIVEYLANTAKIKSATDDIDKQGGKVSKSMKGVGTAIGGAFAVAGVVAFGKSAVSAAQESEVATSRLEQVFKSMGDTTGEAAKSAEDYASALSAKTAIEDESIMAGQAILATFSKVSDQTARMAGVFDRATAAGADMAAAGFGSIESNAVQLGKALQDPVKGITALAKSGVTFTAQEKEKIKTLVESGKQLEAQNMILGAIETQVKGTAEATASESAKMNVAFGETSESLGKVLLPFIEALAPLLAKVAAFIAKNSSVIVPLVAGILAAAAAIKIITIAQIAWNLAMTANPIGVIIVAIAALGVAIYLLVKNWDKVKEVAVKAMEAIRNGAEWVLRWFKANWPLLLGILTGPFGLAVVLIIRYWDQIKGAITRALGTIKGAVASGMASVKASIVNAFAGAAQWLYGAGRDVVLGFVNGIKSMVSSVVDAAKGVADAAKNAVKGALTIGSPSRVFYTLGSDTVAGFVEGLAKGTPKAEAAAQAMALRAVEAARGPLSTAADSLSGYLTAAFGAKQQAAETPAERQLRLLQEARDKAGRAQALADAQAQLAAAQTDEERLAATKAVEDAKYAIKVAALQKEADAQRKALEGRQFVEQQAFDKGLASLNKYLNSAHATAEGARKRIAALSKRFGVDMGDVGDLMGKGFAKGMRTVTADVVAAARDMAEAVKRALKEGLGIRSPSVWARDEIGANVAAGVALGIRQNAGLVNGALGALAGGVGLGGPVAGGATPLEVRVFIGDQELRGLVRTEITKSDTGLARTLLAGGRA